MAREKAVKPKKTTSEVKKPVVHRPGVTRTREANALKKRDKRIIQFTPFVQLVRNIIDEVKPNMRLSKKYAQCFADWLQVELLDVIQTARLQASVANRRGVRASDLHLAQTVARPFINDDAEEVKMKYFQTKCNEAVASCFSPTGEPRIQPYPVHVVRSKMDFMNLLAAVNWRVVWPNHKEMQPWIVKRSIWLAISASGKYHPAVQRDWILKVVNCMNASEPLPEGFMPPPKKKRAKMLRQTQKKKKEKPAKEAPVTASPVLVEATGDDDL